MAYENKTKATAMDVAGFVAGSAKPGDGAALCALMAEVTGVVPKMWGPSIVGFGTRTYDLAGGKQGEICALGFSPRKSALVLYLKHTADWDQRLQTLGKHSTGKGCLYINKLADVDETALKDLLKASWKDVQPSLV
jgi:Domain of unknown function (DU1801)